MTLPTSIHSSQIFSDAHLGRTSDGAETIVSGSLFQRGTTLYVKKLCMILQIYFLLVRGWGSKPEQRSLDAALPVNSM